MSSRHSRAWVTRAVVVAAVFALPLLAAGSAEAAIAGANPATTTIRPDLRSATVTASRTVQVCFDKTLISSANPGQLNLDATKFHIGGYRAARSMPAVVANIAYPNKLQCANVSFTGIGDIGQYTYIKVDAGVVHFFGQFVDNNQDSVTLTGSTTHNGTRGLTTQPDLVGIGKPSASGPGGPDHLTYVFDQAIGQILPGGANNFYYEDAAGNLCNSFAAAASGTVVVAVFHKPCTAPGPQPIGSVVDAVNGGVNAGAVNAAADPTAPGANPEEFAIIPNAPNGGHTSRPDLTNATLDTASSAVTYTYDQPIAFPAGGTVAGQFRVWFSNGTFLGNNGATITSPETLVAHFPGLSREAEYAVLASNQGGSVADVNTGLGNHSGAEPIGGNAGGFARGFTTGPDVFLVTFDRTTGVATVNLDQRLSDLGNGFFSPGFDLQDGAGDFLANPTPFGVSIPSEGAGPEAITVQFPPSSMTNAAQLAFDQGAMTTTLTSLIVPGDAQNIPQIVEPVSSAVTLRADRAARAASHKTHHRKHSKKHSKKH